MRPPKLLYRAQGFLTRIMFDDSRQFGLHHRVALWAVRTAIDLLSAP